MQSIFRLVALLLLTQQANAFAVAPRAALRAPSPAIAAPRVAAAPEMVIF